MADLNSGLQLQEEKKQPKPIPPRKQLILILFGVALILGCGIGLAFAINYDINSSDDAIVLSLKDDLSTKNPGTTYPPDHVKTTMRYYGAPEDVLIDCHPDPEGSKDSCESRGCEWRPTEYEGVPWCVIPPKTHGYYVTGTLMNSTEKEFQLNLRNINSSIRLFPMKYYDNIRIEFYQQCDYRLRVKIHPPTEKRYEVPISYRDDCLESQSGERMYRIDYETDPEKEFWFKVTRTGYTWSRVVFDTRAPGFIFGEQFIQLTTRLVPNSNPTIYGFGEHYHESFQHNMNWKTWTIFTRDNGLPSDFNLYGAHPVHMYIDDINEASIIYLKNSNAMEIALQPDHNAAITYRTIGGILDFYMFFGPTPIDAIKQYTELVGRPIMPPYWGLGFHLSRWGYKTLWDVKEVVERQKLARIPQDVQWIDIDYMYEKLDYTYNKASFAGLPEFIDELHSQGKRLVAIQDIGIGIEGRIVNQAKFNSRGYNMYEDLINSGAYVRKSDGDEPLIGEVWPGKVVYPDFTNMTSAEEWWLKWMNFFYHNESVKYDGLWIDMNEPSNFVPGSQHGCEKNKWNNPPYCPNVLGRGDDGRLYDKTVCMDSTQEVGLHYDVHSLYAHFQANVTNRALKTQHPGKRPFIVTRSSFAGTGQWSAKWEGDNRSEWAALRHSLIFMMEFSMFGFAFTGADICGFWELTTDELCLRWQQVGAFYPFARNHNGEGFSDQDPAVWLPDVTSHMWSALDTRYRLLPYLYTLLHEAHTSGSTVIRPLVFEFPSDSEAKGKDEQFMWGPALLITPVLYQFALEVKGFFPSREIWYDYYNGTELTATSDGTILLDAPWSKINLHIRGGHIIPWQQPANSTFYSRRNGMGLIVALGGRGTAEGRLFWDDGESDDVYPNGNFTEIEFSLNKTAGVGGKEEYKLSITVTHDTGPQANNLHFTQIDFYGLKSSPSLFNIDGNNVTSGITEQTKIVALEGLNLQLTHSHMIHWDAD